MAETLVRPDAPAPALAKGHRIRATVVASFRQHVGLIAITVAFLAAGFAIGAAHGVSPMTAIGLYMPTYIKFLPFSLALILAWRASYIILVVRPRRPLTEFIRELRDKYLTLERLAVALPVLLIMPLFGGVFTLFKSIIPALNPFSWDPLFAEWDTWLHFGYAPWELLQPLFGHPIATRAINWLYNFWFFPLWFVWVWQAFSLRDRHLRLQFFYSLLLTWILLGVGAATYFSSAGPCYYGRIGGGSDPFMPLMDYLATANERYEVWALTAQEMLWNHYTTGAIDLGAGISAMPSMHVAMVFIFVLLGFRTARWLGWVCLAFFVSVLIGSVHLGWHYAIDGYAGAIGAAVMWWGSGRLAALTHPPQPTPAAPLSANRRV
ncbi:MAG: phosphatase PAP2 family protein [Dongiaceae bacterium]